MTALLRAERLHPAIVRWLPNRVERIVEVGAGSGRLTLELVSRCDELTAIEPAAPLREILTRNSARRNAWDGRSSTGTGARHRRVLDALPVADRSAELVVACSVLTRSRRMAATRDWRRWNAFARRRAWWLIVWPNHPEWLAARGYRYLSFAGDMGMEFASITEAIELAQIFTPTR